MESVWPEVEVVEKENRHELSLKGQQVNSRIAKAGLDPGVFMLTGLNHLEISMTCLSDINVGDMGNLSNLTSLILCSNKLTTMPSSLGKLSKLKVLDLSNNELTVMPDEINGLTSLEVFNINKNQLESFPSVSGLVKLHKLNLSFNKLKSLPEGITNAKLVHLSHLLASTNNIEELPSDLSNLPHLNVLDISENNLRDIPPELAQCARLKELNLRGNKVKDRKLLKLLEQSNKKTIFDFLYNILEKQQKADGRGGAGNQRSGKSKKKSRLTRRDNSEAVEELVKSMISVLRFPEKGGVTVHITPKAIAVRPYIVCCVVKNVDFSKSINLFKSFITLQTKLHDTICDKRQAATIATHDLSNMKSPLVFDAKVPTNIKITPLFGKEEVTAHALVSGLRKEADEIRKEKKRNKLSGIHKYLDFLHEKPEYPCLIDADGRIISFPPITNSEITKISKETTMMFLEVTSSRSLPVCKDVMSTLLMEMLHMGIGELLDGTTVPEDSAEDDKTANIEREPNYKLTVEQVRVLNEDNSLHTVYPSHVDLQTDSIQLVHE